MYFRPSRDGVGSRGGGVQRWGILSGEVPALGRGSAGWRVVGDGGDECSSEGGSRGRRRALQLVYIYLSCCCCR